MADFGFCLPIFAWPGAGLFRAPAWPALNARRCMALGRLADDLGYASLWVADHLMLGADEAILEGGHGQLGPGDGSREVTDAEVVVRQRHFVRRPISRCCKQ